MSHTSEENDAPPSLPEGSIVDGNGSRQEATERYNVYFFKNHYGVWCFRYVSLDLGIQDTIPAVDVNPDLAHEYEWRDVDIRSHPTLSRYPETARFLSYCREYKRRMGWG